MGKTGTKKLAGERDVTQYCIDGYLVNEVLDKIPTGVTIIGAKVCVGQAYSKKRKAIPTTLKKLGVTSLQEHKPALDARIMFDEVSKATIKRNVHEVCAILKESIDKAYFQYITLQTGKTAGKFVHTTKEKFASETDLRKKVRVMGLEDVEGDPKALIRILSAKKYVCSVSTQQIRTIMCTTASK